MIFCVVIVIAVIGVITLKRILVLTCLISVLTN